MYLRPRNAVTRSFLPLCALTLVAACSDSTAPARPKTIVFASANSAGGALSELFTVKSDGTEQTQLTSLNSSVFEPIYSPDGRRIAFVTDYNNPNGTDIYLMEADGSGLTRVTAGTDDFILDPTWSPDGTQLAFALQASGSDVFHLFVINADGTGQTQITDGADSEFFPFWSSTGRIYFTRSSVVGEDIFALNPDGTSETQLTNGPSGVFNYAPQASPNGSRIVFIRDDVTNADVYVMNADGSGLTALASDPATDQSPSWSRDGRRIAFSSSRDVSASEIYVMNADGSNVVRLTRDGYFDDYPNWKP